jgi:hypothetical protein
MPTRRPPRPLSPTPEDPAEGLRPPRDTTEVWVRYDGPSGVLVSSDGGEPIEFRLGEVTKTTRGHLDHLAGVVPDHVLVEVDGPDLD